MRAIFWREVRELALVGVPLLALAVAAGRSLAGPRDRTEVMLNVALLGGVAVGIVQGLLDRLRDRDPFFLHRPLSSGRREAARALAGVATCAAAGLACLVSFATAGPSEPWRPWWRPDGVAVLLAASLLFGSWAVLRLALSIRSRTALLGVVVVVPVFALARFTRCATPEAAVAFALGLAAVCGAFRFVARRARLRAVLVLALAGGVLLEGAFWLRAALANTLVDLYPNAGITHDGALHLWEVRGQEHRQLDRARRELRRWSLVQPREEDPWPVLLLAVDPSRLDLVRPLFRTPDVERAPVVRFRFAAGGPSSASPQAHLLQALNRHEAARRGIQAVGVPFEVGRGFPFPAPRPEPPVVWADDGGRIVCRERASGREVATLGRLPVVRQVLAHETDDGGEVPGKAGLWLAPSAGDVFRLVIRGGPRVSPDDASPVAVHAEPVPLPAPSGPARVLDRAFDQRVALLHRAGRLLFLDGAGHVVTNDAWGGEETWRPGGRGPHHLLQLGEHGAIRWLPLVTRLSPAHPTEVRLRLRLFRVGEPVVREDVVFAPRTFPERLVAWAGGLATVLRPPVLNALASASAPPATWEAMNAWWWRTPYLAGGRLAGWLVVSLVLGLLCAWCARREARLRCRSARAVRLWSAAALALGPLGLAWMALVVGRVPVERVGTGRRAVDLDTAPACADPWPGPDRTAIEVVAR